MWGKLSRHQRGYGSSWDKLRKVVIERDKGLCQMCIKAGRITPGKEVDHIVSKAEAKRLGWTTAQMDGLSNLKLCCPPCHAAKTEEEQGKTKRPPKPTIGADGWPIDTNQHNR